ncbi:hypothetical protein NHJ13734_002307 [Beauveria thailandica]
MDAQNAAETDQARSSAASPQRRRGSQVDAKIAPALDSKTGSSPPEIKPKLPSTTALLSRPDDGADDRDSDAETIVLPGKDGHSPSKVRKVRQEDKSESDADALKSKSSLKAFKADVDSITARPGDAPKKKRHSSSAGSRLADKESHSRGKDRAGSSGLSSAPTSPTQTHRRLQHRRPRSRSDAAHISESDSDEFANKPPKSSLRDKIKSGDRINSQKRKAPKVESDDEVDLRKARRQRTTSVSVDVGRNSRDARVSSRSQREARSQSRSPPPRNHRRSASTQLPSSNGLSHKKKRLPPPLQSTEYHSDDSSTSESPHPRSTKLRSLVTPSNSESHMSPAKVGPHKKHLDAHGQTLLARACARGEYDVVKQRLGERPEDLNVADYAGNTPLQIAAINGCEDIVKLLIQAGCNMDCVNYDKDTPLLDAVDNGHLEVVKLLLDAGVNPRKANVSGQEPIDRVTEETDHADEIRALLIAARKKAGDRMRTSEDRHSHHDFDTRDSHAPESPRRSPAAPSGRRSTTGRATKTRNDLLYMPLDDKTLRQAAGRGDEETVARILQVKEGFDDPESMVAAARGGHDLVIQLLLGLGGANADPGPVASLAAEFATPVLAAIGQENIKVVKLLLEQQGFDPTRRFKGETYYEIARRRQGPNWKEEEDILRAAYDEYKRTHKDGAPNKSPGRKERERDEKRAKRDEARVDAKRERKTGSKLDGQGSKRRSDSFSTHGDEESAKRGPGRPRKEEKLPAMQDIHREASPNVQNKSAKMKRAESDAAAASSDGESVKPRRKLVSKGELRGEREKKGRVSAGKEPTSPKASRNDETAEKQKLSEKYHDRTKALKHDPSREIDTTSKRHRKSTTPERSADADKDEAEVSVKRRRLEIDAPEKKSKRSALEDKTKKTNGKGASDEVLANDKRLQESRRRDSDRSASSDKVKIKSEDVDIAMTEAPLKESSEEGVDEAEATRRKEEEEALKKEKKRLEEEQARRLEEGERKAKEEERQRREAEAARLHEEEEKRKREEEERRQREEEERRHREQLEREAEEAKRQQEEEERKERERRHREEVERKRAAREAEAKRIREEEERARLDKLPPLLRWLQICPNPKLSSVAEKFRFMSGVRYDTIHPAATGTAEGREQWVLNTHVALLLGEKDLNLSRYTAWDRAPVSHLAKMTLWRTEWELYSLLSEKYWDIGQQLPDYYSGEDPTAVSFQNKQKLKQAAWERFSATEMFFVKLSELLYTVPNIPHLRNVTLAVEYRELLESEAQAVGWKAPLKWKQDPGADRFHGFAPRYKYYLGGYFLREDTPTKHLISSTPFPEKRVPRRGLVQVFPDDPEYEKLCLQQGLEHLVKGQSSPSLPNGVHTSAMETKLLNGTNGHGHGHLEAPSVAVNGGSH